MWRNVSWNSTDSSLPEGMHKHETGAYFKTPSIQSATSTQSGGTISVHHPVVTQNSAQNSTESMVYGGAAAGSGRPVTPTAEEEEEPEHQQQHVNLQQQHSSPATNTTDSRQQQRSTKSAARGSNARQRGVLKDSSGPHVRAATGSQAAIIPPALATGTGAHHQGFRSRLSSISGALQHPKLAKRLFSGHHEQNESNINQQAPIQITTTSIDSPLHLPHSAGLLPTSGGNNQQHHLTLSEGGHSSSDSRSFFSALSADHVGPEARLMSSSSGRRLSQLFLPQLTTNLNQDPYASNELMPPHLLGLYGQPPLVGGAGGLGPVGGHRASWADIGLFGRLSNVRPSIDSAFHSGQMRHSFDARK